MNIILQTVKKVCQLSLVMRPVNETLYISNSKKVCQLSLIMNSIVSMSHLGPNPLTNYSVYYNSLQSLLLTLQMVIFFSNCTLCTITKVGHLRTCVWTNQQFLVTSNYNENPVRIDSINKMILKNPWHTASTKNGR